MGKPGQPASARLAHALTGYIHISAVHAPPRKRIVGSFEKFEGLDVAALIERNWSALCALMDAGTTDEFAWRISDIYDQESGENCELHMTNWQAQLMTRDGSGNAFPAGELAPIKLVSAELSVPTGRLLDRKSTRLNSSH